MIIDSCEKQILQIFLLNLERFFRNMLLGEKWVLKNRYLILDPPAEYKEQQYNSNKYMKYNFDEIIDRKNTDAYKYDNIDKEYADADVLPMWVADMDFKTPPFVIKTIENRLRQQILGYTCPSDAYYQSIVNWCDSHYGWKINKTDINYVPGVVCGIYLAMQAFTEKGDKILIQEPVYHPFRIVPEGNERTIVFNHLERTETSVEMNLDSLRKDIKGCKMMILCNPHNPFGKCWDIETLREVAHICYEEGVVVVSDEIHCDMVLGGRRHIPFATVSDEARSITITLQAPTKTFNLPGIVCAHAVVVDSKLRRKYFNYIERSDMALGNVFAFDCAKACYSGEGDDWRKQMLEYVEGNIDCLTDGLAQITDKIKVIRPEASFLVFLDCRGLGFGTQSEYIKFFTEKCHLYLNQGEMFGPGGHGYMRINLGCPRDIVRKALGLIKMGLAQ